MSIKWVETGEKFHGLPDAPSWIDVEQCEECDKPVDECECGICLMCGGTEKRSPEDGEDYCGECGQFWFEGRS